MTDSSWLKQTDQPLFPDLLWSRPENKQHAGKLLIIGGNLYGFAAPASAYQEATKAGIGVSKVLLPDALKKTVGRILENGEYAPSTPSGSFNQQALASWLDWSQWADAVLLAGDLGRNSETAIAIEHFVDRCKLPMIITKDAVDYFYTAPEKLFITPKITLVLSLAQLQKLGKEAKLEKPVQFSMGLPQLVAWLQNFTAHHACQIVTYHQANILVASKGKVSTTQVGEQESWRVKTSAHAAVWWLQNPSKPLEALTTAVFEAYKDAGRVGAHTHPSSE